MFSNEEQTRDSTAAVIIIIIIIIIVHMIQTIDIQCDWRAASKVPVRISVIGFIPGYIGQAWQTGWSMMNWLSLIQCNETNLVYGSNHSCSPFTLSLCWGYSRPLWPHRLRPCVRPGGLIAREIFTLNLWQTRLGWVWSTLCNISSWGAFFSTLIHQPRVFFSASKCAFPLIYIEAVSSCF